LNDASIAFDRGSTLLRDGFAGGVLRRDIRGVDLSVFWFASDQFGVPIQKMSIVTGHADAGLMTTEQSKRLHQGRSRFNGPAGAARQADNKPQCFSRHRQVAAMGYPH